VIDLRLNIAWLGKRWSYPSAAILFGLLMQAQYLLRRLGFKGRVIGDLSIAYMPREGGEAHEMWVVSNGMDPKPPIPVVFWRDILCWPKYYRRDQQ
jgi:hypothetical protein